MKLNKTLSGFTALALMATMAQAQIVEDFENGNPDGWRMEFDGTFNGFSNPAIPGTLNATGGNPGGMLSWTQLQSPINVWHLNSEFSADWKGDFRARGISGVSMDMNYVGISPFGMHMYVVLADDMGTPEITDDILIWTPVDFAQYSFAGFGAALPPGVWNTLHWDLPSSSTTLPAGWTVWSHTGTNTGSDDVDWNNVIQNVDYLAFVNGAPWGGTTFGFIDIDFDNLTLETGPVADYLCFGDGTDVVCPCGNNGAPGEGCANSTGSGSLLTITGSASVSANDMVLTSTGSPANKPGVFFQGDALENGGMGVPFGDGVRCIGGTLQRFGVVFTDASGGATVNYSSIPGNAAAPGDTLYYQWWHRDPNNGPCSGGFNVSNAGRVVWLP